MTNRRIQTATLLVIAVERNSSIITEVSFPSSPLAPSQAPKEVHFQISALWHPQRKQTTLSPGSDWGRGKMDGICYMMITYIVLHHT